MNYPHFEKNNFLVALTTLLTLSLILNALLLYALYSPTNAYHYEPRGLDAEWPYTIEVPSNCKLSVAIHYNANLRYSGHTITNLYYIQCGDTSIGLKIHAEWNNTIYSSYHIINYSSSILTFTHIWDDMPRIPENGQDPDILRHSFSYSVLLELTEP